MRLLGRCLWHERRKWRKAYIDADATYGHADWLSGAIERSRGDGGNSVVLSSARTVARGTRELYHCLRVPAGAR